MDHTMDAYAYSHFVLTREDDTPMQIIDIHGYPECAYCGSQYETWQPKCSSCGAPMRKPDPRHYYEGARLRVTEYTEAPGMTCQQFTDGIYLRNKQGLRTLRSRMPWR